MDVSIHALRAFVAACEEGQFGRAAARLHVTVSALGELIARTEQRVNTPLFHRTPRGVRPTDAGLELLPLARAVLDSSDAVADWASAYLPSQSGAVRVGVAGTPTVRLRAEVLDRLREKHPELSVVTQHRSQRREALEDVRSGRLDVVFVPDVPGPIGGLRRMRLAREARMLLVPSGHPLADRTEVSIAETADDVFLTIAGNDTQTLDWWIVDPRPDGSHPMRGPAAGDFQDLLALIAAGRGLGLAGAETRDVFPRTDVIWVPLTDVEELVAALCWRADERNAAVLAYLAEVQAAIAAR
jgi:DNA-binding transcriptional LysR family regulator